MDVTEHPRPLDDAAPAKADRLPLVVDLDGTLVRSDLRIEGLFALVGQKPRRALDLLAAIAREHGPAVVGPAPEPDLDVLPIDAVVKTLVEEARREGRPIHLISAAPAASVEAVARHLGLDAGAIIPGDADAGRGPRLVARFGPGGYDYIGSRSADLPSWAGARRRIAVRPSAATRTRLDQIDPEALVIGRDEGMRPWRKLLRVHQWAKNALVLVPLLTAQRFDLAALTEALAAFLAFSLMASGVYILNDLVDIAADRRHRTKRFRPLAAGTVPLGTAALLSPILLVAGLLGGALVNVSLVAVLVTYFALTTAYTFALKRKMMVDVVALSGLYTLRVIGGAVAVPVPLSEWLLAFSMFMFTALALIKRYVELAGRLDAGLSDPQNRNYRIADLSVVAALAAAAGFNAVTVFALYVSSDAVRRLYAHPRLLWLVCPILLYWLGRALIMANRRLMNDDPIVFALRDWNSLLALALIVVLMIAAT